MVFVKSGWKPSRIMAALLLLIASVMPIFNTQKVAAYGQLNDRAIKISDSTPSATDVTYSVSFEIGTTSNVGGMVIEFCAETPIIQDTCTAPTGFNLNTGTLALANQSAGTLGANTFTIDGNSDTNTLRLTRTVDQLDTNDVISFDLGSTGGSDGVTNPSTLGSFYARMVTYTTSTGASTTYTSTSIGAEPPVIDAGGIALSTADQIIVTAKVQERLTFCVYSDNNDAEYGVNDCVSKSGTAVLLGDDNGVLDPTGPYTNKKARYTVSTNASGNVAIRLKGGTLTSGTNTIDAIGTELASNPTNTEQFGLCTYEVAGTGLTPDTAYDGAAGAPIDECENTTDTSGAGSTGGDNGALFAFDTNTTDGTGSTYGDDIASKAAGDFSTGVLVFLGNISNTTEAGIYLTTLTFIATGTY